MALAIGVVVVGIIAGLVWYSSGSPGTSGSTASGRSYQVADPGPGRAAPPLVLTATDGSRFDLSAWRGKTVLLYFQEGISCEPCWTQLKDIEANPSQFQGLGIDQIVSITGDSLSPLRQKVALEGVRTPVLADPGLRVSAAWGGNTYGMMGMSADGHSFVLVGPDGVIKWRADYGGPPNYTMYVPVSRLVGDIKDGMGRGR
ncbi:MAG TPA: redoxin domain-containing protein [Candidatus Eisenbacteria bacterium]|nr:redoxin domain-containing protein [Candidatus Eisenbacteria bacterium]